MRTVLTLTALLLTPSIPTIAQEDSKLYFLATGGISQPKAPNVFKDGWKDGTSIGAGVGYRISPRLSVQTLIHYDLFEFDGSRLLDGPGVDPIPDFVDISVRGGDTSVLSLSGELKASLRADPDRVSPYVTVGGGVAEVKISDATISTSFLGIEFEEIMEGMSESAATATAGLGLDVPLGKRLGAFVEGRYQTNFTQGDTTDFGSFRAGIRINR